MSQGQLNQTNFMENTGGLNIVDSVFKVTEGQAIGGVNFDYSLPGGFQKRLGAAKINSSADAQLKSLGFGLHNTAAGVRSLIRGAGTELQLVDTSTPSFTALSEDTAAAGSAPLTSSSTVPLNFSQFNGPLSNILWSIGGGQTLPNGVYSTTKYTQNGVPAPTTSAFNASSVGSGGTLGPGVYRWTVVFRKTSTQALSNAGTEVFTTLVTNDSASLSWTFTNNDTTKFDAIYLYRSALAGSEGFTTGTLVATLSIAATTYTDTGTAVASAQNIPRAGNLLLDNSVLSAATYNAMTVFKRRLVVATDSTINLSDLNKSESWPTSNSITIPSGGNITGLAVISYTSPQANTLDEILCIFKQREVWVLTGNSIDDWVLKFIDQTGCANQSLIVTANGFLSWIDYRGVYLWDGSSKPTYCSRLLETFFAKDGDLDKTKLSYGVGQFYRKGNQIIWYLSSKLYGEQKFALKLDLRQTLPQINQNLTGRTIDAVFSQETYQFQVYSGLSYIPATGSDEYLIIGDSSGYCYHAYNGYSDGGADFNFSYKTKPLNMGDPNSIKYFHKVIVWVQNYGDWNLLLDYWSDFKVSNEYKTTKALPISENLQNSSALWDVAYWDLAYWDNYTSGIMPVVFNLDSGVANSNQGTALQLQFRNETMNQPIIVHGFSVLWSEMGGLIA
jgi:hypothetical protein